MNYLTTKDLCEKLHIDKRTAYKLFNIKGFPVVKIGNKYIICEEDLDKFISKHYCSRLVV